MRYLVALFPLLVLLSACGGKSPSAGAAESAGVARGDFLRPTVDSTPLPAGDFANNPAAERFIDRMVQEHGFGRGQLHEVLAQTRRLDWVIRLMDEQAPVSRPPSGPNGAWIRYRGKFITPDNVRNGLAFWQQYDAELQRAWRTYGVPPEIIVGIIGVETRWGRVTGKTRVIDALATLAFAYPRRADYFTAELETFLLMARSEGYDPLTLRGSYAGAMGYGQFMPSSFREYAVDFDGDGHIDLWNAVDAIGSVANYFKAHGWAPGGAVAVAASGQAPSLAIGFNTRYSLADLTAAGLRPLGPLGDYREASLLRLDLGERYQYWYGLPNFYVITRYNRSTHYAMAVWQLGETVGRERGGASGAYAAVRSAASATGEAR